MNCREAERQIFAERDGALDPGQRAALAEHVAGCQTCRRVDENLAAVFGHWKAQAESARTPDSEREWIDLRRRMRTEAGNAAERRPSWRAWLGAPLAAAAALAAVIAINSEWRQNPAATGGRSIARAEYVEVPSANASTVVFVDDKSGWLVVLASDAPRQF